MAERDLDQELRSMRGHVAFPPTPDIAGAVSGRLRSAPRRARWGGRLLPLAAALVVAALTALLIATPVGMAVADRLGLRGVEISRVPAVPTASGTPSARAALGERLTIEQAASRVGRPVLSPQTPPDEVYLSGSGMLSFVYRPGAELPPTSDPTIGALLTQFPGGLEPGFLAKGLGPDTRVEQLTLNGGRAVWIEGRPHLFYYKDTAGEIRDEVVRLAGNVLLWEREGLTLRLEANVSRDEALRIAGLIR